MAPQETPLEMTARHVHEGLKRIARQEELIVFLQTNGWTGTLLQAREFLGEMLDFQRAAEEHHTREVAKAGLAAREPG